MPAVVTPLGAPARNLRGRVEAEAEAEVELHVFDPTG